MTESSPEAEAPEVKLDKVHTQRARWATRKMTVKSSSSKRLSLLNRMQHKRALSDEKKSADDANQQNPGDDEASAGQAADEESDDEEEQQGRSVYVNQPLPQELLDEDGHPKASYPRNKIRTAKYTPLSFIPKNLFFQFLNIANVFFLFLIVLGVCFTPF